MGFFDRALGELLKAALVPSHNKHKSPSVPMSATPVGGPSAGKVMLWTSLVLFLLGVTAVVLGLTVTTSNTWRSRAVTAEARLSWIEKDGQQYVVSVSYTVDGRRYDNKLRVSPSYARTVSRDYGMYGGLTPTADSCRILCDPANPQRAMVEGQVYDEQPRLWMQGLVFIAVGAVLLGIRNVRKVV